jgi:acyl carrier protein
MESKQELTVKVKEILIYVLNLDQTPDQIDNNQSLFGTDDNPGLFDDSLAVLEVTSVLMAEFDADTSIFNEESFQSINSLSECIYNENQIQLT